MNERQRWLLLGMAIGAGAATLFRDALKPFGAAMRPLAKSTVKAGLLVGERAREKAAEMGEMLEDLIVEVQAEREIEVTQEAGGVPDFGPPPGREQEL
jgi:hypothetical protein